MILADSNKGQSEILGIVLLLSISMLAIGMILTFGEPALSQGTEMVDESQVENEFSLLDARLATSALGAADTQNTELNLNTGTVRSVPDGATMWVSQNFTESDKRQLLQEFENGSINDAYDLGKGVTGDDPMSVDTDELNRTLETVEMGKIEYEHGDSMLAYEGGGVWRMDQGPGDGSVMISPPEFHYQGRTLTLPLFNITTERSISADRTDIEVNADEETELVFERNPVSGGSIVVTVESSYYRAWGEYFDERTQGRETVYEPSENRATVELVVPDEIDVDGGQAFRDAATGNGNWEDSFQDGYSEGEFYIDADSYIQDGIDAARSSNDNSGECIDEDDGFEDCGGEDISGGTYYIDGDAELQDGMEFDEDDNVTVAIDGGLHQQGGTVEIDDELDGDTAVEFLVGGGDFTMGGNPELNYPDNGNSSDMLIFVGTDYDVEIDGGGGGGVRATLYAPGSSIEWGGMGGAGWEGGIIANDMHINGGGAGEIYEGEEVDLDLTQGSSITYLHVTENEVSIE